MILDLIADHRRRPHGCCPVRYSGIYRITNTVTGEFYIGQAVDILRRLRMHFRRLIERRHANHLMQRSFDQYGRDAFSFELIKFHRARDLPSVEWAMIGELRPPFNLAGPHLPPPRLGKKYPNQRKPRILAVLGLKVCEDKPKKGGKK